jgi:hypothetical protein
VASTLKLTRTWSGMDGRTWDVVIDGQPAGSIGPSETVDLEVQPGGHTVRLRSTLRFVSPQRSFEAADGQVVSFTCHATRWWPRMLASLVKNDLWITLREHHQ